MGNSRFEIVRAILTFMGDEPARNFQVGTAKESAVRLPGQGEGVSNNQEGHMSAQALSPECAKDIAHFFVTQMGMDGFAEDKDELSDWVYVLRKST